MIEVSGDFEIEREEKWNELATEMFAPSFENDEAKEQFLQECFAGKRKFPWHFQGQSIGITTAITAKAVIKSGGIPVLGGTALGRIKYEEIANSGKLKGVTKKDRKELSIELNERDLLGEIESVRREFPHAILGVNILHAIGDFESLVCAIGQQGMVDVLYVGAGLPTNLSKTMEEYPNMRYMPIVSTARAVSVLERRGDGVRRPNGYVYEDAVAAGHNASIPTNKPIKTTEEHVIGIKKQAGNKPVIMAGGIRVQKDIQNAVLPEELGGMGVNGIGLGTRGLLTQESGMDTSVLKKIHLNSDIPVKRRENFSPTGLPSTGKILSCFHEEAKKRAMEVRQNCVDCLNGGCRFIKRELDDMSMNFDFCILVSLIESLKGKDYGVFFMGKIDENESLYRDAEGNPYIPTVREMIEYVIHNKKRVEEMIS